jgi:hypothetical protein
MTLYEYNALDLNNKADILWNKGLFIESSANVEYGFNLYSLNGYYIEVTVIKPSNEIIAISAFKTGERLLKYLDAISLDY